MGTPREPEREKDGAPRTAVPVVLDTDPGVDDAMAIFYGLLAPEIEVVAIGTVWGNGPVETTTENALRLIEIAGCPEVPVAAGASKPLVAPRPDFGGLVHGHDGQGNVHLPPPALHPTGETAAAQLIRLAHERPGVLTLVAVGPLTNLATALALNPGMAALVKHVVVMGGAFLVPGNATSVAEANIWHDPEAAQIVLDAGWPVTLVGLDVTETVRVSQAMLDDLRDRGSPVGHHLHRISGVYLSTYEARYGRREAPPHDALALGIAADPGLLRRAPRARVDVELAGTHTRGMTVVDRRAWASNERANARVALAVDGARFLRRWLAVVGGDLSE